MIKRHSLRGLALAFLLAPCLAVSVAFADDQEDFRRFLGDPAHLRNVLDAVRHSAVFAHNPCASAEFAIEPRVVPYEKPGFDGAHGIVAGSWKHGVDEQGCGTKRRLNVLVAIKGPHAVSIVPLLPGSTRADPVLQRDATGIVLQAVATAPASREPDPCQVRYFADTEFVSEDALRLPGSKGPAWLERWTLVSCTLEVVVPVHFIPDATGTSISAGPGSAITVRPLSPPAG